MNSLRLSSLAFAAAALLLGGCSSYERDWKKAASPAPTASATGKGDAFTGRWDGRWTSAKHRVADGYAGGRLRCLLAKVDDRHYEARFKANWMIFTSTYRAILDAQPRGRVLLLDGQHQLPGLLGGGSYRYRGKITPEQFSATYEAAYDSGTFDLRRPQSGR